MSTILLLGGGAVALLYLLSQSKKNDKGLPPGFKSSQCIDPQMPANVAKATLEALQTVKDPQTLATMAQQAAANGFAQAAACFEMLAEEYGKGATPPPGGGPPGPGGTQVPPTGEPPGTGTEDELPPWLQVPPTQIPGTIPGTPPGQGATDRPHTIRYGDMPYYMAQYFTGQGARFRELEPGNPHLGKLTTVDNVSNYPGWQPGVAIMLPLSWNPWDKPIPAPLKGSGGGGDTSTPPVVPPVDLENILTSYPWPGMPGGGGTVA